MDGERVCGAGTGQDLHGAPMVTGRELMGTFGGHKHDCRRAVTDWAAVHDADGRRDERGLLVPIQG